MKEVIGLEVLGIGGIFSVYTVWSISVRQYIISVVCVLFITGIYLVSSKQRKVLIHSMIYILFRKQVVNEDMRNECLIGIRRVGIFIILLGGMGVISIMLLSNRVFISMSILANGMGITAGIILNSLIIESIIILPLMTVIKFKKIKECNKLSKKDIIKNTTECNRYTLVDKIK